MHVRRRHLAREQRRSVGRTLRSVLVGTDEQLLRSLADSGTSGLEPAARSHRLAPALRHRLVRLMADGATLPPDTAALISALDADTAASAVQRLMCLADLREVSSVLSLGSVDFLVLKGAALAQQLYPVPELRPSLDIDVLVRPEDLARAVELLEQAGATLLDQNWSVITSAVAGELHLRMRQGSLLDLHWTILFHRSTRDQFALHLDEWFPRAVTVATPVGSVRTTGPTDTLLHLCLHAMASGGHRLLWLYDVHLLVLRGVDWVDVVDTARRWRLSLVVGGMLLRCRTMLGTPVPDDVVAALLPRSWHAVARTVDALSPVDVAGTQGSLARLVARATRGTAPASFRRLVQQAVSASLHRERWQYTTAESSPSSLDLAHASNGPADARTRFLETVSTSRPAA